MPDHEVKGVLLDIRDDCILVNHAHNPFWTTTITKWFVGNKEVGALEFRTTFFWPYKRVSELVRVVEVPKSYGEAAEVYIRE